LTPVALGGGVWGGGGAKDAARSFGIKRFFRSMLALFSNFFLFSFRVDFLIVF